MGGAGRKEKREGGCEGDQAWLKIDRVMKLDILVR